jgi:hypothetical protein
MNKQKGFNYVHEIEEWHSLDFMKRQSADHPENNLAKFGYIIDMKVEKKQNPSIFLVPS